MKDNLKNMLGDYVTALEKENERLQQENKQLKEDKKKAIEYIKNQEDYFNNYPLIDKKHLLEILGDKE